MTRSVLVPLDGSEQSLAALEYALETFVDAELTLLHAIDPFDQESEVGRETPLSREWLDERRAAAADIFDAASERIVDDVAVETDVSVGSPAQTILGYAEDEDVDEIVIGSHGLGGASDLRLGSVSEIVVRRAAVPVTVVR